MVDQFISQKLTYRENKILYGGPAEFVVKLKMISCLLDRVRFSIIGRIQPKIRLIQCESLFLKSALV